MTETIAAHSNAIDVHDVVAECVFLEGDMRLRVTMILSGYNFAWLFVQLQFCGR